LIVVDGRSSDGTERWLRKQHDIAVIPELEPQGFVKAVNLGFRCAAGKYISWLNDDAEYEALAIENAVGLLSLPCNRDAAVAAFYYESNFSLATEYLRTKLRGRRFKMRHVRGLLFANFGLFRKSVLGKLGYFDERFSFYGADPDFCVRAWRAGYRVIPSVGSFVIQRRTKVHNRTRNVRKLIADNEALLKKHGWQAGTLRLPACGLL